MPHMNMSEQELKIGDIGYKFRKKFDEGWFTGSVVSIRPGAAEGKDRRCVYSDGDVEDLTLAELKRLARLDPKCKYYNAPRSRSTSPKPPAGGSKSGNTLGKSSASSGSIIRRSAREATSNIKLADYQLERPKTKQDADPKPAGSRKSSRERRSPQMYGQTLDEEQQWHTQNKRAAASKPSNRAKIQKLLSSLSDGEVPVDKAAESTIKAKDESKTWYDITDELDTHIDQNEWLEKVASQLGARRQPMSRNSVLSLESQGKNNLVTCSTAVAAMNPNDSTIIEQPKNLLSSMPHSIEGSSEYQSGDSAQAIAQWKKTQAEASSECSSVPSSVLVSHKPSLPPGSEAMRALIDVEKGSRHEYLVFRKNDPDRLVGEVLIEGTKGWVEVCFGGTDLVKCRSSHLIVLPRCKFSIGDNVPIEYMNIEASPESKSYPVSLGRTEEFSVLSTKKSSEKKSATNKQHTVNLDDIFYWVCECETFNAVKDRSCKSCRAAINGNAKTSKLLEIATDVVNNDYVSSLEEAIVQIPDTDRQSIPDIVLAQLLEAKFPDKNLSQFCKEPSTNIETFFYWSCGSCTMQNSYKKGNCYACRDGKGFFARSSPLLLKAEEIALQSNTPQDAYARWPASETRQIPEVVMDSLITCVHIICKKGSKRRCRNRKLEGVDYCQDHCDPALLTAPCMNEVEETSQSFDVSSSTSLSKKPPSMGIETMKPALHTFLTNKIDNVKNGLGWCLDSVEDALVCGSDLTPFPLGMKVRVYFVGYGFHDGRIMKVRRQYFSNGGSDGARPVLVYRVIFNDGDQQDWLHHNISSLRQVFDVNNIDPEALPEEQIPPGTLFEMKTGVNIKIMNHIISSQNEQVVSFVIDDDSNETPTSIELSLVKFQEAVRRKIDSGINTDRVSAVSGGSIVEWPVSNDRVEQLCTTGTGYKVCNGLHFLGKTHNTDYAAHPFNKLPNVDDPRDARRGMKMTTYDPANIRPFVHWDPSQCLVCQLCGIDKDDNQVVICDECHLGFHSYCLRPVMVNIPMGDWVCRQCSGVSNSISFAEYSKSITGHQQSVLQFLNLPYKTYLDFANENIEAISYCQSPSPFNPSKHTAVDRNLFSVGSVLFVRHPAKYDFRLPSPTLTPDEFALSVESFVAAMKYCGMSTYSESNTYPHGGNATEDMNDPASEKQPVVSLSKRNLSIFRAFKENLKRGIFPPVKVMHDERYGFYVEALKMIPKHTLIAEYTGEIITLDLEEGSESDSLMILLDSGDPKTSLIIDPTNAGNIARFLSGVNNKSLVSKRKANVRTRKFCLDGKLHVVLFTSRRIEPGESLNYDYNAGRQGQSSEEWLKGGFYDTSNFF